MVEAEIVLDVALTIGESPLWCEAEAALYLIDVKAPALFRLHPTSGRLDRWAVTSDLGAFTLLPDRSGALVALRSGLARLDFATGGLEPVAPAPFDPDLFRFNEGGCDPDGRFWVGVMFDPVRPGPPPRCATLHSYTTAEGLRTAPDASDLHNGMAWSADGARMFLSHSNRRRIHSFARDGSRLGPAVRRWTPMAATGAPCTAGARCGGSTRTAPTTATCPCPSASRPCAASAAPTCATSTSPAPRTS